MKIKFTPGHGLAIHIDGQLAGVITKPGASISPDADGYEMKEAVDAILVNHSTGWIQHPLKLAEVLKPACKC